MDAMSVPVLYVQGLVEALERIGVSREHFLRAAWLEPNRVRNGHARLEPTTFDAALETALALSGDEAFGLRVGDMVNPVHYNIVFHIAAHAPTLGAAIDSMRRFFPLLSEQPFLRLVEGEATACLLCDVGAGRLPIRRFRAEFAMVTIHRFFQYLAQAKPLAVMFDYPSPSYHLEYTRCFGGVERFGTTCTGLVFDRSLLVGPNAHADPDLHAVLVAHAEKRVSQGKSDAG
jgi:hypothetical protein